MFLVIKKSFSKTEDIITSIIIEDGTKVLGEETIKTAYVNEFITKLRTRELSPNLKHYEKQNEKVAELLVNEAK